jgi:transketolase
MVDQRSLFLRRLVVRALVAAKKGHIGSAFSLIEILRVLYDDFLVFDPQKPLWDKRDRLILSKGHGCLALYAILADKGFFDVSHLDDFCSVLPGLSEKGKTPGVEATTGSLGHGLSLGVGTALALRVLKKPSRVVVILGDGEMAEGSIWEAALACAKHQLSELTVIVDCNQLQIFGSTQSVSGLEPILEKWKSFGFATQEVNGHDVFALKHLFSQLPFSSTKPSFILCHTIKGYGFAPAESSLDWHYKFFLTDQEIQSLQERFL